MVAPLRLSASRIKAYRSCPRAHAWGREGGHPRLEGEDMAIGSGVHAALRRVLDLRWAQRAGAGELALADLHAALAAVSVDGEATLTEVQAATAADVLMGASPIYVEEQALPPETAWSLDLGDGLSVSGIWDLVVTPSPDRIEVQDWKSGAEGPGHDAEHDPQVALYLLAAVNMWPTREVSCCLRYLATGESVRVFARPEVLAYAEQECRAVAASIRAGQNHPTPGAACSRCFFRGTCDAATAWLAEASPQADLASADLLELRQRLRALAELADQRRHDVDDEIARRLQAGEVASGDWVARRRERRTRALAPGGAAKVAEALGVPLAEVVEKTAHVSVTKLDKLTKGNDAATATLAECCEERISVFVEVRKAHGD